MPIFVHEEGSSNQPIASMPGINRLAYGKNVMDYVAEARSYGVNQVSCCLVSVLLAHVMTTIPFFPCMHRWSFSPRPLSGSTAVEALNPNGPSAP
jgi:hypothetical protein